MSLTVIGQYGITLYDVSTQIPEKSIIRLIQNYLPNARLKINRGDIRYKMGKEVYSRVYIVLDRAESVDILIKQKSNLRINGEQLKVMRTLPKSCSLYDRSVTGLKIKLHQSINDNLSTVKVNESDLRKYFQRFGIIRYCQWINNDQTEALFAFVDSDSVDKIIFYHPLLEIKRIKIDLEKAWTNEDYKTYERSYVIHVTNLPVRVTSEEISTLFKVPIAVILLYPCFQLEQSYVIDGRSSSEGWIKNFSDEKTAQLLAEQKTGTFLRTNKIQCQAMLEIIDNEQELCEQFQKGQCQYTMETCYYKHFSCSEPDTCDNENCWFGHTQKRLTKSINRSKYRSEGVLYRVKISNLPSNVTYEELAKRLKIDSQNLILQPTEKDSNSSRMAYLIRQPLENKLRQLIDRWHNTSFSAHITQKIQCQLEINQEFFDWNDSTDMKRSTALNMYNTHSNRANLSSWLPSTVTTDSGRLSQSREQSQMVKPISTHPPINPKNKPTTNTLRSKSIPSTRQPPSNLSDLLTSWRWINQMILNDQFDHDELYWIENKSTKEKNVVIKIYSTETDRIARVRAQRERFALEHLIRYASVPKLLHSNIDLSNKNSLTEELWIIMRLIDGERLSDYVKGKKIDLREGLQITRRLLNIIKEIHARNVIHRNIQPKNILIGQQSDIMLINFNSAWINNDQRIQSFENLDEQLGNQFYLMPQFEIREDGIVQKFQRSTTIDTTGICAILFWLITNHEPKESRDLEGKPPHRLRDNSKIIEKKINEMIGFRIEMKIHEHFHRHLMLIFDRAFGDPNQQWSVDELDYQLQLMTGLIESETDGINYFPLPSNLNSDISSLSSSVFSFDDPFVYVVSLIYHLKKQFTIRYSNCIQWSTNEKNHWFCQDEIIQCNDLLNFSYQTKTLSINIQWNIKLLKDQHFSINIKTKLKDKIHIELPLGIWKINEQINDFYLHLNNFQIELKILIKILFK